MEFLNAILSLVLWLWSKLRGVLRLGRNRQSDRNEQPAACVSETPISQRRCTCARRWRHPHGRGPAGIGPRARCRRGIGVCPTHDPCDRVIASHRRSMARRRLAGLQRRRRFAAIRNQLMDRLPKKHAIPPDLIPRRLKLSPRRVERVVAILQRNGVLDQGMINGQFFARLSPRGKTLIVARKTSPTPSERAASSGSTGRGNSAGAHNRGSSPALRALGSEASGR